MTVSPQASFQARPWPVVRNAVIGTLNLHRRHTVYGFGEVDVTRALDLIGRYRRDLRIAVSFHAFVAHCLTRALQKHPIMHTFRHGRQLIRFDDIDVSTAIDRRMPNGMQMAVGYTLRAAQTKSLAVLNWELRQATNVDLALHDLVKLRRRIARMPAILRDIIAWRIRRNPHLLKRFHGTVGLTNLQSPGLPQSFQALPPNIFTYTMAICGLTERDGRKILCLSGGADHAIVDGLPLSRFAATLNGLLESAAGLDDSFLAETRRLIAADEESAR